MTRLKSIATYVAIVVSGFLMLITVLKISTIAFANDGIYPFDKNAVYLEGEACTVNLEDHITQQYAANMLNTCLEYHELYLEKISIIQGE